MNTTADQAYHIEAIGQIALFDGLGEDALRDVYAAARLRPYSAGAVLFRQEEQATTFYVVLSGRVRITEVTFEGHTVLLRFIQAGQMLGGMAALEEMTYPVNAEVVEQAQALTWSTQTIAQLMDRHPQIMRNAMRVMVQRIRELQQRSVELATERVEQRVARALLRLVRQAGERTDEGVAINIQLSRQDLAELTGTTLYTVSRILTRWQGEGLVKVGRQRVVIRKAHAVVEIAEGL